MPEKMATLKIGWHHPGCDRFAETHDQKRFKQFGSDSVSFFWGSNQSSDTNVTPTAGSVAPSMR